MNNRLRLRVLCLIAAIVVICSALFSCSGDTAGRQKTDVMKDAFDLLDEIINSEYYLKGFGVTEDRYGENLQILRAADLSHPGSVFRFAPDFDVYVLKSFGSPLSECDGSERLKDFIVKLAESSFFSHYFIPLSYASSDSGVGGVAMSSYYVSSASGYDPGLSEKDFLVYFYEGFAVCAEVSGDESGMRSVVLHPYFTGTSAPETEEKVKELLGIKGDPGDPAISKVK